jgi:hypothetical protein
LVVAPCASVGLRQIKDAANIFLVQAEVFPRLLQLLPEPLLPLGFVYG